MVGCREGAGVVATTQTQVTNIWRLVAGAGGRGRGAGLRGAQHRQHHDPPDGGAARAAARVAHTGQTVIEGQSCRYLDTKIYNKIDNV